MIFRGLDIPGAFLIAPERMEDERGFFARTFCEREFGDHGLCERFVQCSMSYNRRKGTLRGLHYQAPPHGEAKLVRCTMGAVWDVVADLRPGSPARGRWHAAELSAVNRAMVYVPEYVAHGFITLTDDSEVFYQMAGTYHAGAAAGVRWDSPSLGIAWPMVPTLMSERDASLPLAGEDWTSG